MIGQTKILTELKQQIDNHTLPQFVILVGPKGSGKKILVEEIRKMIGCMIYKITDVKIDSIRWMIEQAYKTRVPAIYQIADADSMSINAKNAILKITEEPPNQSIFIMTLEDERNTLETIRSRGTAFHMDRYTPDEIYEYAKGYSHDNEYIIKSLCETPGEVDMLYKHDVLDFYRYVEKVFENIGEVSGANAFKIADKIALKEDEDKYDIKLFWKAFQKIAIEHTSDFEGTEALQMIKITSRAISDLRIKSINKAMLFDKWIISIREVLI